MDFTYFITVNKYWFCISVIRYINIQKINIGRSLVKTYTWLIDLLFNESYLNTSGSSWHLSEIKDQAGLYRLNIRVTERPAMEPLKTLHGVLAVCDHLDVRRESTITASVHPRNAFSQINKHLPGFWRLPLSIDYEDRMTRMTWKRTQWY